MKAVRKIISGILAVAVLFSGIPTVAYAKGEEDGGLTDAQTVSADKEWLTFDTIKGYDGLNVDSEHIIDGLYLPESGKNGSTISWVSSDDAVIKGGTEEAGYVTRSSADDGNKDVTLTATLKSGDAKARKTFLLTVLALESTDLSLNELHARQDYIWLTYSVILNKNENNGTPPNVTTDLSLPTHGENGSDISWTTSDKSVISTDGTVTQPPISKSEDGFSYPVTVTAEITGGDYKLEKSFLVHVDCLTPTQDEASVAYSCMNLTLDRICGFNTQDCVLSNVYPNADVQLVQSNGKLYAIWTDDNSDRSGTNRTQLRYSVYNGDSWSEPAWLGTDATGDFSPAAAAAGEGTLIAWQDMKKELNGDADADEASQNCEISVSKDPLTDGNTDSFETVRLTDDNQFDHSPKIAADGDSALVAWTKSDGLALDGTATNDTLWFAKWTKDGGWNDAGKLADIGHTVVNSALTMHDGKAILLYTVDMDGNLSTSDDQEIYTVSWNGLSWETPVRMTNNKVEDSSPQVTYCNGNWLIVWNQNNQTVYRAGIDGKTKTEDSLSGIGNKFQLVSTGGDNPQVTLVYYIPGDNGTRGLSESTYDAAELWGNEKTLTDGTGGYTGSFSSVYTDDGQLKSFYTKADMVTESINGDDYNNSSDKADLELLTYTPEHDLALDVDDGMQLSVRTPVAGVQETVKATVNNLGDYAENATVVLYRGDPSNGVKVAQSIATAVAAHSSAQVKIDWLVNSDFSGACDLYAVVSPTEGITDADESNNTISRMISTSDLSVSDAEGDYIVGNKYRVRATVKNVGSDTLKNVVLNLTDDKSVNTLASETIEELDPGMTGGFDQIISTDKLTADSDGNYNVMLKAVLPAGVTDNNADNNTDSFELEAPFITVDSVSPAPNEEQVELQKPIVFTFNMKVKQGSSFDGICLTDSSLNPVKVTAELKDDTLTITPKENMTKGTEYTLTIPTNAITDDYGHKMEKAYTLTFTTVTTSPAIIFANSASAMTNAPTDSDIRLKYNQTVNQGSDFSGVTVTNGSSQNIPVSATLNGQWLTLHPSGSLSEATQYSVTVPRGAVTNVSGEVQQQAYSYSFTTESSEDESLSNLQSLVSTCSAMIQGNYTSASWASFQTALQQTQSVLDAYSPTQDEINSAFKSLTAAKNALTEKSNHSSSGSDGTPAIQNSNFKSDTTATYRFGQNNVYYYKITTTDTTPPTAGSSNPLVATVELAQKLPDGYLFRITDVGGGTAVITTTAASGTQTMFTVQGTAPQGILSDTPFYHSVKKGSTYQFKFTVTNGSEVPSFTSGNSKIAKPVLLRRSGNVYYFKVIMLADGCAGIYITLPGNSPTRRCVMSSSN